MTLSVEVRDGSGSVSTLDAGCIRSEGPLPALIELPALGVLALGDHPERGWSAVVYPPDREGVEGVDDGREYPVSVAGQVVEVEIPAASPGLAPTVIVIRGLIAPLPSRP